jgi:hypothetical protein
VEHIPVPRTLTLGFNLQFAPCERLDYALALQRHKYDLRFTVN